MVINIAEMDEKVSHVPGTESDELAASQKRIRLNGKYNLISYYYS